MAIEQSSERARRLVERLLECSGQLDQAVASMQKTADVEDFKIFRREVGAILGEIYLGFLQEIFAEFPALMPEDFK